VRAVEIVAHVGAYNTLSADRVRRLEDSFERWVSANSIANDEPMVIEIAQLLSDQIYYLEIGDGYRVVADSKIYRITRSEP